MRADRLIRAIQDIRSILGAAGATAAETDFEKLEEFIDGHGDRDLDELLGEVRAKLDPAQKKQGAIAQHLDRLKSAGFDEAKFHAALQAIKNDKALDKDDVLQIAKAYGVIRISGKSKPSYIESIDKYFYWRLYNRDADEMAKRATPW
jgi:ribosomal protein L12E/L44/L45/RPP1/RPP2